jgi:hypothetical protein
MQNIRLAGIRQGRKRQFAKAREGVKRCAHLIIDGSSPPQRPENLGAGNYAAVLAEALTDLRVFSCASAARISERRCWT